MPCTVPVCDLMCCTLLGVPPTPPFAHAVFHIRVWHLRWVQVAIVAIALRGVPVGGKPGRAAPVSLPHPADMGVTDPHVARAIQDVRDRKQRAVEVEHYDDARRLKAMEITLVQLGKVGREGA